MWMRYLTERTVAPAVFAVNDVSIRQKNSRIPRWKTKMKYGWISNHQNYMQTKFCPGTQICPGQLQINSPVSLLNDRYP